MLEISGFKSFTGHLFENKEDCMAWEKRAMAMQKEVMENFKNDIVASDPESFPEELLKAINNCEEKDYDKCLQALAKIAYWFNNSGLNYDMNFVCYDGKGCRETAEWLNRKETEQSK